MKEAIDQFIGVSFENIKNTAKGRRYFHTLLETDAAPLVVHHQTTQFTYVINGFGTAWIDGKKMHVQEGDKIFVNVGMTHKFKAGQDGLTLFHIHIPDDGRENDREILEGGDYNRYV